MSDSAVTSPKGIRSRGPSRGVTVLVKGAGDVGSAVAHRLFSDGFDVILVEGLQPSTARRLMSFSDTVFLGEATLDDVAACRAETVAAVVSILESRAAIPVWVGSTEEITRVRDIDIMVDGRMRKREQPEVQIGQASLTIGLGPGFVAGSTADLAVETSWGENLGKVIEQGPTEEYTGQPREVMGFGRERYSYAPKAGVWRTTLEIGQSVSAGAVLGTVDGSAVESAIGGAIRGVSRDGINVAAGAKLVDVDPRGVQAPLAGIAERPRRIADGVARAIESWLSIRHASRA